MKSLIYLIAGVAIGILIAPEKGSDTRKKLVNQFDDLKGEGKDLLADAGQTANAKLQSLKSDAERKVEQAL